MKFSIVRKNSKTIVSAAVLGAMSSALTQSSPAQIRSVQQTVPQNTMWIDRAASIHLTPKGQKYLYDHAAKVIDKNGIRLADAVIPEIAYKADEPLTQRKLTQMLGREQARAFEEIQNAIKHWLSGMELKDPQFQVKATNLVYTAKFKRLGVRVDEEATRQLGVGNGVALVAELESPELKVNVSKIHANDLRNRWLGVFGINGLWASFKNETVPLRIQAPIEVSITEAEGLKVNVRSITTNVEKIAVKSGFTKLVMPPVSLIIDGRETPLDPREIEADLNRHKDQLFKALQIYAKDYSKSDASKLLNRKLKELLADFNKGDVDTMEPISCAPGAKKIVWGLRPSAIEMRKGNLYIDVDGMMEDPLTRRSTPAVDTRAFHNAVYDYVSRYGSTIQETSTDDVVISVNQNLANRALQMSYLRGCGAEVDIGDGEKLKLLTPPTLVLNDEHGANKARIRIDGEYAITSFAAGTVRGDKLHFQFDIIVRFEKTATGVQLIKDSVDMKSIWVDPASIVWWGNKVRATVRNRLEAANAEMKAKKDVLADVPVPAHLAHIPLNLRTLRTKDGFLQVYLNFGAIR